MPTHTRAIAGELASGGHRVIGVAAGPPQSLRLAGLIALSDPPRADSAGLVAALRGLGVRTVMVTGDSAVTAAVIARKVGIDDRVCPPERLGVGLDSGEFGVFARVVPEQKYRLVTALQRQGHVVGMCGEGANDAPALRQAQIGIAVSSAADVAKAASGMVLTTPGLAGILSAVREGRIAFQRLLTYTLNMLVKKIEIVLFLAIGLVLTGQAVMTPVLMVLMLVTNDFLSMSLMTDRAMPGNSPSRWHMRGVTPAAVVLGAGKLAFQEAPMSNAETLAALSEALDDEYRARATYSKVIEHFGPVRPFVNIVQAEDRHIAALLRQFERFGARSTADAWQDRVMAPD
jgi:H+-transporting ATPase